MACLDFAVALGVLVPQRIRAFGASMLCLMTLTESVPGFPSLRLLSWEGNAVTAELCNAGGTCQSCLKPTYLQARLEANLYDLPRGWEPSRLTVHYRQLRCRRGCRQRPLTDAGILMKSFAQVDAGDPKRPALTQRLYDALLDRYLRGQSLPALAAWSGVPPRILWPYLRAGLRERMGAPRDTSRWATLSHIGIDELFWRGQPLGVIIDLVSGELIELLPDRDQATVTATLNELKTWIERENGAPWCPVITSDMWGPFRASVREVFGAGARLVVDRFHLEAKVAEDLQKFGQAVLPPGRDRPQQLRTLRNDYFAAQKSGQVHCGVQSPNDPTVHALLLQALELACEFKALWTAQTPEDAEQARIDWLTQRLRLASDATHEPFDRIAYLLAEWRTEILAFHRPDFALPNGTKPTNAKTESLNRRLRLFERRSKASRRLAWGGEDDERAQVQLLFDRFAARALYSLNQPRTRAGPLTSLLSPLRSGCPCGAPAEQVDHQAETLQSVWDLPLGDRPVRAHLESLSSHCTACGHQWSTDATPVVGNMTARLLAALSSQVAQGRLLGRLSREAGPSPEEIAQSCPRPQPIPRLAGIWIGILKWRWRRKARWLITDIETGQPLELLDGDHPDQLIAYLASPEAAPVQIAFVSSPHWCEFIPANIKPIVDMFSAVRLVQPVLREVQWRFTSALPVETRQSERFRQHRRLIHERPDSPLSVQRRKEEPDPEPRRTGILKEDPWLHRTHVLTQEFRAALQARTVRDSEAALKRWTASVTSSFPASYPTAPMEKSYVHGFRQVMAEANKYRIQIAQGAFYRDKGKSLARSKQVLRKLKTLEAAGGKEFSTLRLAVLTTGEAERSGPTPPKAARPQPRPSALPSPAVLSGLTEEQQAVVDAPTSAPVITVMAVAGSGKTRVLVERAKRLVGQRTPAKSILFLSFSSGAADELRRRLKADPSTRNCYVSTLHAFCRELLGVSGATAEQVEDDIQAQLNPQNFGCNSWKQLKNKIGHAKQSLQVGTLYDKTLQLGQCRPAPPACWDALAAYEQARRKLSSSPALQLSHDDTLLWALSALNEGGSDLAYRLSRFRIVIVDEYQDVSPLQAVILEKIAKGKQLMAVGDPAQSIFGFQGSSPQLLQSLADRPDTLAYSLSDNFRSPGQHLLAASSVLTNGPTLLPATGFRGSFHYHLCATVQECLEHVVDQLRLWHDRPVTVLVRRNKEMEQVQQLIRQRVQAASVTVRDPELAQLARWNDPGCQRLVLPLLRTLQGGYGKTHPLHPALQFLGLDLPSQDRRWLDHLWQANLSPQEASVREQALGRSDPLRAAVKLWTTLLGGNLGASPHGLLIHLAPHLGTVPAQTLKEARELLRRELTVGRLIELLTPPDRARQAGVKVMTVHKAKGREFPAVIVVEFPRPPSRISLSDEQFRAQLDDPPPEEGELQEDPLDLGAEGEEQRIAYVALTRSQEHLCLITGSSSLYSEKLAQERKGLQTVHEMMSLSHLLWTQAHLQAWPKVAARPDLWIYLERYWWQQTDRGTLQKAHDVLLASGMATPPSWDPVLEGRHNTVPATVRVQRRPLFTSPLRASDS